MCAPGSVSRQPASDGCAPDVLTMTSVSPRRMPCHAAAGGAPGCRIAAAAADPANPITISPMNGIV